MLVKKVVFSFKQRVFSTQKECGPKKSQHILRTQGTYCNNCLELPSKLKPVEPKSVGHVTIIYQMLASITQVFCVIILPRSDKRCWESLGLLPYFVTFLVSFIQLSLKQKTVL